MKSRNGDDSLKALCTFDAFDFWSPLDLMELNPYIVLGLLDLQLTVSLWKFAWRLLCNWDKLLVSVKGSTGAVTFAEGSNSDLSHEKRRELKEQKDRWLSAFGSSLFMLNKALDWMFDFQGCVLCFNTCIHLQTQTHTESSG